MTSFARLFLSILFVTRCGAADLATEQRAVDELLAKSDAVQLRHHSARVFALAERLLKEKGDAAAKRYFERGLEANSWALEHQLTLGEILARAGQKDTLRDKAEMVLRVGEEGDVLQRAAILAGRARPEEPVPFASVNEPGPVLVLVPVGESNPFLLRDLRDALAKGLGIKVVVAALNVKLPPVDRNAKQQWVTKTREQLLDNVTQQPGAAAQLEAMGFTAEGVRTNDASFIALTRKITEQQQGAAALVEFDAMLAKLEQTKQWEDSKMLAALREAAGGREGPKFLVLGVTPNDLFGGTSNYLFGVAITGSSLGVISTHRFRAAFNEEAPQRERLTGRLLKQSLSTVGFMLGVPRCTTPECARAFPRNLAEHDQKPGVVCPACRAGFEKALGQKLPAN